ncbi:MAG: hypothetical protein ACM3NQ_21815 [Bacteroidales bacterium]
MKRLAVAAAIAALLAGSQVMSGQERPDPFFDRSDTGQFVRVLPLPAAIRSPLDTTPLFAPPSNELTVYPASYGSGNLIDHGGPEIANASFWAIYWNSTVAGSTATSNGSTIQTEINAFISSFADNGNYDGSTSDDYEIVQQYGSTSPIANSLTNWGAFVDQQPTQKSISDSKIQGYLAGLFNAGAVPSRTDVIYGVYFPAGMRVTLNGGASCSSFCGYHNHFTYLGQQIKYAVFPYLNCTGCKLSSLTVGDMLTIVASHEIREAVTDPGDANANAWYDSVGYEADDKCAWHNLYQMTNGGFWVQPEFSNGGTVTASGFTTTYPRLTSGAGGCVVPNK